jgi:glucan phosphoethanolaminetransferase (alkaline phosphatase superfamily)
MFDPARLLFFAAWMSPMAALPGGGLPVEKIVAACIAAAMSGALLCSLPLAAFRIARGLILLLQPLSLLWIGYVSLNGMGPTAIAALGAMAHTNIAEATTALHLLANAKSLAIGGLQLILLVASYACGKGDRCRFSGAIAAAALTALMLNAWIPQLLSTAPSFLPGRDDLQNFPYGSVAELAVALVTDRQALRPTPGPVAVHRIPRESAVQSSIDAIFILGETFRFERPPGLSFGGEGWSALQKRFRAGLGVYLPKVCASADSTAISVPLLLTGTSPQANADAATAPSGLARLAAAGYETAWISNQAGNDLFGDEHRDLFWMVEGSSTQLDEALLPMAFAFLGQDDGRNKAVLLHFLDSHAAYADRYPPLREPDQLDREHLEALRYERANDHTLTVLASVAAMIDGLSTPAFVVYVSDHGENLLVDHNGIHFHIGARTTAKAAYVPSFVLWNGPYLQAFHPRERLRPVLAAPALAHADVYRIWVNFAGLDTAIAATPEPQILGKANLTDPVGAISCSALSP